MSTAITVTEPVPVPGMKAHGNRLAGTVLTNRGTLIPSDGTILNVEVQI